MDPYLDWLGIPADRRPHRPHDLLGIDEREVNIDRIEAAILDRSAIVRPYQSGRFGDIATDLLNEIAEAGEKMLLLARQPQPGEATNSPLRPPTPMIRPRQVVFRDAGSGNDRVQATYGNAEGVENEAILDEPVEVVEESAPKTKVVKRRVVKRTKIAKYFKSLVATAAAITALAFAWNDKTIQRMLGRTGENKSTAPMATAVEKSKPVEAPKAKEATSKPAEQASRFGPARFQLAISPENATVTVRSHSAQEDATSEGRILVVTNVTNDDSISVIASAEGFETLNKVVPAKPGDNGRLFIILKELRKEETKSPEAPPSQPEKLGLAILGVAVTPANATVDVFTRNAKVEQNGSDGSLWTVAVKDVGSNGVVVDIRVTAPGYAAQRKSVFAKIGENGSQTFVLDSLDKKTKVEAPTVGVLLGRWAHYVNGRQSGTLRLLKGGKINDPASKNTWLLNGFTLELRWPNRAAPGHAWVDKCKVAPDGKSYSGRNQKGDNITGRKVGD